MGPRSWRLMFCRLELRSRPLRSLRVIHSLLT
ncbi:putative structural protein [Pseudomonas phage MR1]|uniref:Putative structural protein n=1 Tax=Pseudomonas phage MR1 TaxID=2711169 RepID=A0A6M3T8M7_9CAUD|nr:putative structural protein [Pseudomonas phage MR1]